MEFPLGYLPNILEGSRALRNINKVKGEINMKKQSTSNVDERCPVCKGAPRRHIPGRVKILCPQCGGTGKKPDSESQDTMKNANN